MLVLLLCGAPRVYAADTVVQSRALAERGKDEQAIQLLAALFAKPPVTSAAHAEMAQLRFLRGEIKEAEASVAKALAISPTDAHARWIKAEILREQGKFAEALAGYKWHFTQYNRREIEDAEELYWVALGVTQYVRWQRLHDAYGTLVNDVYPQILKLDPKAWRAHLAMGRLFLEKYNLGEADRQFVAGLKINPEAAELHAERARMFLATYQLEKAAASLKMAREINPRLLAAAQT